MMDTAEKQRREKIKDKNRGEKRQRIKIEGRKQRREKSKERKSWTEK